MVVSNINVYGLENSIKGSKYPMSVDVEKVNTDLTKTCIKLAK